jgi:DNA invertase Pin-like site-specific DNA recombinase
MSGEWEWKKRVALYVRVSTDGQTVENQLRELEGVAERHGWAVVEVFRDEGISGYRADRPGYKALKRAIARKQVDLVAAWSVDRLGRSLQELVTLLGELRAKGVDLYLHQQGLDTSTPAGKAMFQMLGVFAEFERSMIVERVRAGLRRARAQGKTLGRPRVGEKVEAAIRRALATGRGVHSTARLVGVGSGTVRRVRRAHLATVPATMPAEVVWTP